MEFEVADAAEFLPKCHFVSGDFILLIWHGSILYGLINLRHFLGCKLDFCDTEKNVLKEDRTSGTALIYSTSTKSPTSTYKKSCKIEIVLVQIILVEILLVYQFSSIQL